jgi:hypothetical protein
MIWLTKGIAFLNAAQVLGASASSKRASNVKSPAWIFNWLIHSLAIEKQEAISIAAETIGSKDHSSPQASCAQQNIPPPPLPAARHAREASFNTSFRIAPHAME